MVVSAIIAGIVGLLGAGLSYSNAQGAQKEVSALNQQQLALEANPNAIQNQATSRGLNMRGATNAFNLAQGISGNNAANLNQGQLLKSQGMTNWGK
jgi:hypothetical protein